ncbi:hypothetical protein RUM44_011965 [Polyplax serrata]|uniref:Uncharacterized protein n=1 Tax=Polyplax serrata TaxID=468196 RepID=A0ABR1BBV7_POLSC
MRASSCDQSVAVDGIESQQFWFIQRLRAPASGASGGRTGGRFRLEREREQRDKYSRLRRSHHGTQPVRPDGAFRHFFSPVLFSPILVGSSGDISFKEISENH